MKIDKSSFINILREEIDFFLSGKRSKNFLNESQFLVGTEEWWNSPEPKTAFKKITDCMSAPQARSWLETQKKEDWLYFDVKEVISGKADPCEIAEEAQQEYENFLSVQRSKEGEVFSEPIDVPVSDIKVVPFTGAPGVVAKGRSHREYGHPSAISFLESLSGITAGKPYYAPNWYVEDISMYKYADPEDVERELLATEKGLKGAVGDPRHTPGRAGLQKHYKRGAHGSHQIGLDVDLSIPVNKNAIRYFPSGASIIASNEEKDCPLGSWDAIAGKCKVPAWKYRSIRPEQINGPAMVKFLLHCAKGGPDWKVKRVYINESFIAPIKETFRQFSELKFFGKSRETRKLLMHAKWLLFPEEGHKNHIHVRLCLPDFPENKYRCPKN